MFVLKYLYIYFPSQAQYIQWIVLYVVKEYNAMYYFSVHYDVTFLFLILVFALTGPHFPNTTLKPFFLSFHFWLVILL